MNKTKVRQYKSHFGARWTEFKHNRKNNAKILLLENKFVLSNLNPGTTVAIDCLGETFKDIINVDTVPVRKSYDNVLLINNFSFKYKTVDELVNMLAYYANFGNRLIVNFNSGFIIYNRLNQSIASLLAELKTLLQAQGLVVVKKFSTTHIKNFGFGNVFLVLNKTHV